MASIDFRPGLSWANLPPAQAKRLVDSDWLRGQIEAMRQEWTDATGDISKVTCNLGAIFDELGELIGGDHE